MKKAPLLVKSLKVALACLFPALITLGAGTAFGAELKIIDKYGLTRADKKIGELATVVVALKTHDGQAPAEPIRITNTEGLAPDITAYPEYGGSFSFRNVRPGVWQLVVGKGVDVLEVKITQ